MTDPETPTSTITALEPSSTHRGLMAAVPGWGRPRPQTPPDGSPDTDAPEATAAPQADGRGDGRGSPSSEQAASIRELFKGRAKSYARVFDVLFQAVGGILNSGAQRELGDTDAWLPDDDDRETVTPPLGRIAARRIKLGVDPGQLTDIEDIGMAAVGIVAWAAKGVAAVFEARRARKRAELGKAVHTDAGDGQ